MYRKPIRRHFKPRLGRHILLISAADSPKTEPCRPHGACEFRDRIFYKYATPTELKNLPSQRHHRRRQPHPAVPVVGPPAPGARRTETVRPMGQLNPARPSSVSAHLPLGRETAKNAF